MKNLSFFCLSLFFTQNLYADPLCHLGAVEDHKIFVSEKAETNSSKLIEEATEEALKKCQQTGFKDCRIKETFSSKSDAKYGEYVTRALVLVEGVKAKAKTSKSDLEGKAKLCIAQALNLTELKAAFEAQDRACTGKIDENIPCVNQDPFAHKDQSLLDDLQNISKQLFSNTCELRVDPYVVDTKIFEHTAPAAGAVIHSRFLEYAQDHKIQALSTCYNAGFEDCQVKSTTCLTKVARCNYTVVGKQIKQVKTAEEILAEKCEKAKECKASDAQLLIKLCSPHKQGSCL